jgi:hypothetical protein
MLLCASRREEVRTLIWTNHHDSGVFDAWAGPGFESLHNPFNLSIQKRTLEFISCTV